MSRRSKINKKNLQALAWARGVKGVSGLARAIKRSRVTVYRSVNAPQKNRLTMKLLEEFLL